MLVSVYKGSKLQLAYDVESINEETNFVLKAMRDDICDEIDCEETQFDLYTQALLMTYNDAICVSTNTHYSRREAYIWFEWGCLFVAEKTPARLYIDSNADDVTTYVCM